MITLKQASIDWSVSLFLRERCQISVLILPIYRIIICTYVSINSYMTDTQMIAVLTYLCTLCFLFRASDWSSNVQRRKCPVTSTPWVWLSGSYLIHTVLFVQSTPRGWCESSETEHFGVLHSLLYGSSTPEHVQSNKQKWLFTSWTRKVAVSSLIATQNRKWSYWHYSCKRSLFKANVCGSFYSIQPFRHFCLITWPLYSDHTTSDGGVLGTASAQLFSDTWL